MRFLGTHPETAFKAAEIAEKARVDENSIHPVLGRLADEGLLEHRRPYWALADDDIDGPEAARARVAEIRGRGRGPEDRASRSTHSACSDQSPPQR